MTKKLAHTVNIALGLTIVIQDDQGHPIEQFIFPFALLFFALPGLLYTWSRRLLYLPSTIHHLLSSLLDLARWRQDLVLIYWAARLLIHQRRFAYA